jgi:hypothetical protein
MLLFVFVVKITIRLYAHVRQWFSQPFVGILNSCSRALDVLG